MYTALIYRYIAVAIAPSEEIKTLFFLLAAHHSTYIYPVYVFSFCQSSRLFPWQVNNPESQLKYTIVLDPRLYKSTCPIAHEDRSVFDFCLSCAIASSSRLLYKDLTDTLSARLEKKKGANKEPNNPSTVSVLVPAGDKLTTASGEDSQKDFEVV